MRNTGLPIVATIAAIAGLASGTVASAQAFATPDFSATAVQIAPDQSRQVGLIVRSGANMRLQYQQDGKEYIRILRPADGVMLVLEPQTRRYFEITGPAVPPAAIDAATPCPAARQTPQQIQCERDGTDTVISGIQTQRWVISAAPDMVRTVFWDPERRKALREEYPDGSVMQMSFVAMEENDGRAAEHWKTEFVRKGADPLSGDWWFDSALRVVVRETLPDGSERRLENIRVAPVDAALFAAPSGWEKQTPPTAGQN